MTKDVTVPAIPKDLLEYLEKVYPERSPRISQGEREIWMQAGKCELVSVLRAQYELQNETILQPLPTSDVPRKRPKGKQNPRSGSHASASI